jgi:alkylation response protein AidB-like acyl-CoA dehydrogenase
MSLLAATERFVEEVVLPNVAEWDREDAIPQDAFEQLVALGLTGALVPAEHGGAALGVTELVPVWRALSRGWISLTGAVNPSGLAATLLLRHGSQEQRDRWLPRLAGGELAAFSITEPQAGSDLARLECSARPLEGGGFELDGRKRWVAGGASASVIFLMALVDGAEKPSCVVLPAGADRDTESRRGEDREMLDALDVGRVNVACRALGIIDRALGAAVGEALGREIGDGVLGDHTHAQMRIGEMRARLLACEALTLRAAAAIDAGDDSARELSTAAKVIASDTSVWAVDRAARLAASRSYASGDELARLRRDAPQTQIGEGANDALLLALAAPQLQTPVR